VAIAPLSSASPVAVPPASQDSPEKVKDAASQFESLLMSELLKAARPEGSWTGGEQDSAGESAMGMAEQYLAQALASSGGLGIADLISAGLRQSEARGKS